MEIGKVNVDADDEDPAGKANDFEAAVTYLAKCLPKRGEGIRLNKVKIKELTAEQEDLEAQIADLKSKPGPRKMSWRRGGKSDGEAGSWSSLSETRRAAARQSYSNKDWWDLSEEQRKQIVKDRELRPASDKKKSKTDDKKAKRNLKRRLRKLKAKAKQAEEKLSAEAEADADSESDSDDDPADQIKKKRKK
jgi:hypothetical protein